MQHVEVCTVQAERAGAIIVNFMVHDMCLAMYQYMYESGQIVCQD